MFEFRYLPFDDPEKLLNEVRAFAEGFLPEMRAVAADTGITLMHAKYHYAFWRPVSAICRPRTTSQCITNTPGSKNALNFTLSAQPHATPVATAHRMFPLSERQ
jgi:hypothetical protein